MNLIHEQHIARLQVGQDGGEVTRLGNHGPGCRTEPDPQLLGDDARERGLAQARRAMEQHMVDRLATLPRGRDEDREILAHGRLADETVQFLRSQGHIHPVIVMGRRVHQPLIGRVRRAVAHWLSSFRAAGIRRSRSLAASPDCAARLTALNASARP